MGTDPFAGIWKDIPMNMSFIHMFGIRKIKFHKVSEGHNAMPVLPENWDGYAESLGFPVPEEGTIQFEMLMCFPFENSVTAIPSVG